MARQSALFSSERTSEMLDQSKELLKDATEKSRELYGRAKEWVPENRGAIIGAASVGVAAGLIGYGIGTRNRRRGFRTAELFSKRGTDFGPVFKFFKLWMLYRLAI